MAETLTLELVCARHALDIAERDGMHPACRCGIAFLCDAEHPDHLADAVREWLLGQRLHVAEVLLSERMDGEYLVGAGRTIGNEGGDVALREARAAEVAWWAADGVLGALTGGDQ